MKIYRSILLIVLLPIISKFETILPTPTQPSFVDIPTEMICILLESTVKEHIHEKMREYFEKYDGKPIKLAEQLTGYFSRSSRGQYNSFNGFMNNLKQCCSCFNCILAPSDYMKNCFRRMVSELLTIYLHKYKFVQQVEELFGNMPNFVDCLYIDNFDSDNPPSIFMNDLNREGIRDIVSTIERTFSKSHYDCPLTFPALNKVLSLLLYCTDFDVNSVNTEGKTILHQIIHAHNEKLIIALLKHKNINTNAKNSSGMTPLDLAISLNNVEIIKLLEVPSDKGS